MAGRFGQANIAGDDRAEDLRSEEAAKVRGYLARKRGSFVIHREQDALDGQSWIEGSPDAH